MHIESPIDKIDDFTNPIVSLPLNMGVGYDRLEHGTPHLREFGSKRHYGRYRRIREASGRQSNNAYDLWYHGALFDLSGLGG